MINFADLEGADVQNGVLKLKMIRMEGGWAPLQPFQRLPVVALPSFHLAGFVGPSIVRRLCDVSNSEQLFAGRWRIRGALSPNYGPQPRNVATTLPSPMSESSLQRPSGADY